MISYLGRYIGGVLVEGGQLQTSVEYVDVRPNEFELFEETRAIFADGLNAEVAPLKISSALFLEAAYFFPGGYDLANK